MHVCAAGRADEAKRGDRDCKRQNRPEERCEWESEETRKQRQAAAVSVGPEAEVPTLQNVVSWGRVRRDEVATYGVFVVCVGASAVAPDVMHAYDDGEHRE